jgi:hypothetical protein
LQGRTGGRSVVFSSQFYLSCDHHLCMWLRVVRPGHLLMFILVASYSSSGGDAESNGLFVVSLYTRTHTLSLRMILWLIKDMIHFLDSSLV